MSSALDLRALKFACQRVEDFALVNTGRSQEDKVESTILWLEFLGLDHSTMDYLDRWIEEFTPGLQGPVMIGLALGLLIQQYHSEHPRPE